MKETNPKIIFLGTPDFGAVILEGLIKAGYSPVLIITQKDKPKGRKQIVSPPPVKLIAQKNNIEILQPDNIKSCLKRIKETKPDLIISAAFGQLIPKEIIEAPKYKSLNVHPSFLPKYRGPSPIQQAILDGEKETGVSIILMDEQLDHGPIVAQSKPIEIDNLTSQELTTILAEATIELLIETVPKWIKGEISPQPQGDDRATYTETLTKEKGKINWQKPAIEIERQIRAFTPWPGSYSYLEKGGKEIQIKIIKAKILEKKEAEYEPGQTLIVSKKDLGIQTGKDILIVESIQIQGGKEMSSQDFLRGHVDFIGKTLK